MSYYQFRVGKNLYDSGGEVQAMISGYACAGCGEWNETTVDESAGNSQSYVEDCQVCCKPNLLRIWFDPEREEFVIDAELE